MSLGSEIKGFLSTHHLGSVTFEDHCYGVQCLLAPDLRYHNLRVVGGTCDEAFQQALRELPAWKQNRMAQQMKEKLAELTKKQQELMILQQQIKDLKAKMPAEVTPDLG